MELATSLGVALDDDMRFIQTDKGQRTRRMPGSFAAGGYLWAARQVASGRGVWPVSMSPIMPRNARSRDDQ